MARSTDVLRELEAVDAALRSPRAQVLHEHVLLGATKVVSSTTDLGTLREQVVQVLGELDGLRVRLESILGSLKE
jgi:hypothetical protein